MPHVTDVGLTAFGQLTDLQVLALLSGAHRPPLSSVEGRCGWVTHLPTWLRVFRMSLVHVQWAINACGC